MNIQKRLVAFALGSLSVFAISRVLSSYNSTTAVAASDSTDSACYMTDDQGRQIDLSGLCSTGSLNSDGNPNPRENTYLLETESGGSVEVTESEYIDMIAPLQVAIQAQIDEQRAESGLPSIAENPTYDALKKLCQNPNECTQSNIDEIVFGGGRN
ncbi:MAG: hypothetical protein HC800_13610 [Phormidesmis sp. RL_2_1]|nr:hypothetical protein [Phormidesmis sp. RL_2_1]